MGAVRATVLLSHRDLGHRTSTRAGIPLAPHSHVGRQEKPISTSGGHFAPGLLLCISSVCAE